MALPFQSFFRIREQHVVFCEDVFTMRIQKVQRKKDSCIGGIDALYLWFSRSKKMFFPEAESGSA
jgi:hypothetical protein